MSFLNTGVVILLAPSYELAVPLPASISIEAEYGTQVKEGRLYTAAHHQPIGVRDGEWTDIEEGGHAVAPIVDVQIPNIKEGIILVSHLDLDTVGGCLRAMGADLDWYMDGDFAAAAAEMDVRGPHRMPEILERMVRDHHLLPARAKKYKKQFHAWWALSRRVRYARDEVHDVTSHVVEAAHLLRRINRMDPDVIDAGEDWAEAREAARAASFVSASTFKSGHTVLLRKRIEGEFVNAQYEHEGGVADIIIGYKPEGGEITISTSRPVPELDCREFMQEVYGPEAGGKNGIAGSPREASLGLADATELLERLQEHLWRPQT